MNNEKLAGMKIGEPIIGHVVDCRNLNVRKDPDENAEILANLQVISTTSVLLQDSRDSV